MYDNQCGTVVSMLDKEKQCFKFQHSHEVHSVTLGQSPHLNLNYFTGLVSGYNGKNQGYDGKNNGEEVHGELQYLFF